MKKIICFKFNLSLKFLKFWILSIPFFLSTSIVSSQNNLVLNDLDYYEQQGINVLMFANWYDGSFSDAKMSGIEVIHHGERIVTNGDVRLNNTPEQWDPIPKFLNKEVDQKNNTIKAWLEYPDFKYMIKTESKEDKIIISVHLDEPLPEKLAGKAGFNLEFLPSAYFEKTYLYDGKPAVIPLYPSGPTRINDQGLTEPKPIARGYNFVFAPEDNYRRITVKSENELLFFDGRNKAQNGWLVLRSLIPSNKTGSVIEWELHPSQVNNWLREPVISFSQAGYHPVQNKKAVIEFDKNDKMLDKASVLKIDESGKRTELINKNLIDWGRYKRYNYGILDFSEIKEPGVYALKYGDIESSPFIIDENVYDNIWYPTLDVYLPVQMDHVLVNEAYRVWHGASHLDDALQAPVNHEHFDMYRQGPTTDTPYKPGEHIPGLNVGGWYDAGDYDIRTQSQYFTVMYLVHAWEDFQIYRDETLVEQENRYVDLHHPDGKNDIIQQIEHGAIGLLAQHKAVGHAIPGIIAAHISQYTHLGDGLTKTDNLIYNPELDSLEVSYPYSGTFDDRWAFTNKSTPLNYGSAAGLAASYRALKDYNPQLAQECLETAIGVWDYEQNKEPDIFISGNTTGGSLIQEELRAATELLISTGNKRYADRIVEMWPRLRQGFSFLASTLMPALPYMDDSFVKQVEERAKLYAQEIEMISKQNPFEVPITEGGWAGNASIISHGITNYMIYKAFPGIIDKEHIFKTLNYIFGCHPQSDLSFVSGIGLKSKKVAYGMNRADYSFIAGGIVPGVLILKPDFPENKEDWPFLWGENEYVITVAGSYLYLANAVQELLNDL